MGYKVNIQKSKEFLYSNNEISETEIRKKIPFDVATRKIKYLGINLTKEVKDLYSENYTTRGSSAASDVYKRQIQHPFLIKTLSKVGMEGAFLNIIKAIYDLSLIHISEPTRLS